MTNAAELLLSLHGDEPKWVQVHSPFPGCLELRLNRPDVRNALNADLIAELTTLLHMASHQLDHETFRLLHLTGEGPVFCAGADLAMMQELGKAGFEANVLDARRLAKLFAVLSLVPVPVVCSVQGAAIGGGLGLAVCADLVISHKEAIFSTSEVRLGLVPAVISPYIVRKLGLANASPALLSGERWTGSQAHAVRLVHELVDDSSELEAYGLKRVQSFLACAPMAQRQTKRLLLAACPMPAEDLVNDTVRTIARARESAEAQYGLSCFLGKSQPQWETFRQGRAGEVTHD